MKKNLFIILLLSFVVGAQAQMNGDYRSTGAVKLTDAANWEVYDESTLSWSPATVSPNEANLSSGNFITIQPGHVWSSISSLATIPVGVTLLHRGNTTADFAPASIRVHGTYIHYTAHASSQAAHVFAGISQASGLGSESTVIFRGSETFATQPTPTFGGRTFNNLYFDTDGTGSPTTNPAPGTAWTINGHLSISNWHVNLNNAGNNVTLTCYGNISINSSSTLTAKNLIQNNGILAINNGGRLNTTTGATLTINGTLENKSTNTIGLNGSIIVNGTYIHNVDANTIPKNNVTYATGSTIQIFGIVNHSSIAQLPTSCYNVVWNCARQTASAVNTIFFATPTTINGDFTILSTGAGSIYIGGGGTARILNIVGDLNIEGGTFKLSNINGTSRQICNVGGNVNVTGGTLIISEATSTLGQGKLDIGGSLIHSGGTLRSGATAAPHTSTISFTGTGDRTFSTTGITNAVDIVINKTTGSVALGTNLDIHPTAQLKVESGTLNLNGKTINLLANDTSMATIGSVTGSIDQSTAGSRFITNRFIPAGKRAYRQIAPGVNSLESIWDNWQNKGVNTPGKGTVITGSKTGANGFDQTQAGAASLYTYEAGGTAYTPVPGTDGTNKLNALQGYRMFIIGDRNADLTIPNNTGTGTTNIDLNSPTTLSAAGTIITGDVIYDGTTATNGATTYAASKLTTINNGYSLIANPYWSPVDFNKVTRIDVADTYWIWDPSMGNRGAYVTYNTVSGSSGGNITRHIQPGQAIFVQTTGAAPSITFKEEHKSDTISNTFRTTQVPGKMHVQLFTQRPAGPQLQDGAVIAFSSDFTNTISLEDATKLTNSDENIALVNSGSVLSNDGRKTPTAADTIPLRMWALYSNNNYTLQLTPTDLDPSLTAVLVDRFTNKEYLVDAYAGLQLPFSFTTDSASFYNRFMLVFKPASVLPIDDLKVKATAKEESVLIEWTAYNENNIAYYEVDRSNTANSFKSVGKVEASNNNFVATYSLQDHTLVSGVAFYRVKAMGKLGDITYSAVVRVQAKGKLSVLVNPNPVTTKQFKLELNGLANGQYQISLLDLQGRQALVRAIGVSGNVASENIQLPSSIPAGNYTVVVRSMNKIVMSQKVMIQ